MSERPADYQSATGHGHVIPRRDGVKARCGGPAICAVCQREKARMDAVHEQRQAGEQPMPTEGRQDIPPVVAEWFSRDLAARDRKGIETYGRRLQTHNGRDAGQDAWEELIDLAQYLTQLRLEHADAMTALYQADEALTAVFNSHLVSGDLIMQVDRAIRRCREAGTALPMAEEER